MTASTLHLPTDFETYSEARRAGFLRMKELKEAGARVVGIFCTFVPTELIYAAGALTGGLCDSSYLVERLSQKLGRPVCAHPLGRYAGALGAALIAREKLATATEADEHA